MGRWELKKRQKLQNLVFPSGLGYDKPDDRVRTLKVNAIFGSIPILTKEISKIKKWRTYSSESILQFSDPNLQKFELCWQPKIFF